MYQSQKVVSLFFVRIVMLIACFLKMHGVRKLRKSLCDYAMLVPTASFMVLEN